VPRRAVDGGPSPVTERLLHAVRTAATGRSALVVLVGDPALTARALDDVLDRAGGPWWHTWTPTRPEHLVAGLRAGGGPGGVHPWTVVRLPSLARFVLGPDAAVATEAAAALRGALVDERLRPLLVLAEFDPLPAARYRLTRPGASGGPATDVQAQALLRAATVLVLPAGPARTTSAATPAPVATSATAGPAAPIVPAVIRPAPTVDVASPRPDREPAAGPVPVAGPVADVEPARHADVVEPDVAAVVEPEPDLELELDAEPEREPAPADRPDPPSGAVPRWQPSAAPWPVTVPEPADAARWRAVLREEAGNLDGAERLYEQAAMAGDLMALARLARLRDDPAADPGGEVGGRPGGTAADVDAYLDQAVAEGNTAVLFTLAAAGHPRALEELARLRAGPPGPPAPQAPQAPPEG